MGRELVRQLAAEGCHVAMCDVIQENMEETFEIVSKECPNIRVTKHICDVSDEEQVLQFKNEVIDQHETLVINLLFNNAGIGGGGSFVEGSREEWERCFAVCWYGVYYCSRAFMDYIVASDEGHIINTSSINGFWATLNGVPHTSYSAAKFAVKGFSEALIDDFKVNAPHVGVSVVMPGHIGTSIAENTGKIFFEAGHEIDDLLIEFINENKISKIDILKTDNIEIGSFIRNTLQLDKARSREEALFEIFKILRPGEPPTIETAENLFNNLFFNSDRYDLSSVGLSLIHI